MISVDINKIVATKDELRFGLVVRYGDDGPVRFVVAKLEDDVLDWRTLSEVSGWITRQVNRHLDRERELLEEGEQPLF